MSETRKMNGVQAINEALTLLMEQDPKVIVLGEDVGDKEGGGVIGKTRGLSTRFGDDRVRSTPISEQAIIGAAIGASLAGYKPLAEIMLMNFTAVAMDMIFNHAAKLRYMSGGQTSVPITIMTFTGAGGSSGGQHGDHLEAWFAHAPGMKVIAPAFPADYLGLFPTAINDPDPVLIVENVKTLFAPFDTPKTVAPIPIGKANIVIPGTDVTIVSYSGMTFTAMQAAGELAKQGVSAEVVDLRSISPWDKECVLSSVNKTGRVVIAQEAVRAFGVGAEIAATINEELFGKLKAPVRRLGAPYTPVPFSKPLETAFVVQSDDIVAAVKSVL